MATKKRMISVVAISLMFLMMLSVAAPFALQTVHAATTTATFGNTVVGPYTDRTAMGQKDSVMYTAPENGIMTSISMYIQTGNALVRYAVYTDNNGRPDQLVAQSRIVVTRANTWVSAPISAQITAGHNYWLTVASNTVIYWNYDFGAQAGNGFQQTAVSSQTYGDFTYWSTAKFSMYATYTPAAQPAPVEQAPQALQTSTTETAPVTTAPTAAPAPAVADPAPTQAPAATQPAPAATAPVATTAPIATLAPIQTQTSSSEISNKPAGLSLKASTDFETATMNSGSVNVGFGNSFQTEGSGGAAAWIEGADRNSGVPAHSGSHSLGMEVTDISQSRRNEFNVYSSDAGIGTAFYVSMYIYLPSSFTVSGSQDSAYWDLFQVASNTGTACPMYSLMFSAPNSDGTYNVNIFARDASANKMGNEGIIASGGHITLPKGQWFHFEYYQVNSDNGVIKAWINGQQIINYQGSTQLIGNYFLSTDLYYNADDTSVHRMWIDDFAIYG